MLPRQKERVVSPGTSGARYGLGAQATLRWRLAPAPAGAAARVTAEHTLDIFAIAAAPLARRQSVASSAAGATT